MSNTDWSQKYRPTKLDDMVLPSTFRQKIEKAMITRGGMSMLFYGPPGTGKTTLAEVLNAQGLYKLNCSDTNSITDIRNLKRKCSARPLYTERRLILLDEGDFLTKEAQAALRGIAEEISAVNDFIMTANEPSRLSAAIHSRFLPIEFNFLATDEYKAALKARLKLIAELETGTTPESALLESIVRRQKTDIRAMIKTLQAELP